MTSIKISDELVLDQIIYQMEMETPIQDQETGKEIPGLTKRTFHFSAPYRIFEGKYILARGGFGNLDDIGDFFLMLLNINPAVVKRLTEEYILYQKLIDSEDRDYSVCVTETNLRLFEENQPSLDVGGALNAFEVRGIIYRWKK